MFKLFFFLALFGYVLFRFGRRIIRMVAWFKGQVREGYQREGDMHLHTPPKGRRGPRFDQGEYVDFEEVK